MAIPTAEGFEGYPATWFYLDRQNGSLSTSPPVTAVYSAAKTVSVSLTPRYLNAPAQALGSNAKTLFQNQGKPSAHLKTQLDQLQPGTATQPLSYVAMYPVIDNPNDAIASTFFTDAGSGDPIQNVPLPGGIGNFRTPLAAVVGGAKPSSLLKIISQVVGLAGGTAGKALFPISAAEFGLASNIESLLNGAVTSFAPETKMQYWINGGIVQVAANQATAANADSDTLQLPLGTTFLAFFQTDGGQVDAAVKDIVNKGYRFDLNRGGQLTATLNNAVVDPNPFANLIYITYRATVQDPPN